MSEAINWREQLTTAGLDSGHIGNTPADHLAQAKAEQQAHFERQIAERGQQIRAAALEAALRLYSGSGLPVNNILDHAKTIEAYLQGTDQ